MSEFVSQLIMVRRSTVEHILILSTQLDLAYFAYLVLPDAVLRHHLVEVVIDFVIVVHKLVPARFEVRYYFALLHEALRYLLFVFPLLLDQFLVFYRDALDFGLELDFLGQLLLQGRFESLDLLDILDELRQLVAELIRGFASVCHFLMFLFE